MEKAIAAMSLEENIGQMFILLVAPGVDEEQIRRMLDRTH